MSDLTPRQRTRRMAKLERVYKALDDLQAEAPELRTELVKVRSRCDHWAWLFTDREGGES